MRKGVRRFELAVIALFFCLPLFFGLGRGDLKNDEAIYSYAVDSILEIGDWMAPRSSPNPDIPFLEKPPLKFWIVAAPIRAGLLPHSEFGLRFWDAFFGGVAFLYVYAIGRRIAGPICGAAAVLLLFVHGPLLFEHGLRENNMEAALLLAYCGGVYHFQRWMASGGGERRWRSGLHAVAVAAFFALGFLTKFVAALFLPVVLAAATLVLPSYRRRLRVGFLDWVAAAGVALALILPWFVYAHVRFGPLLWQVMFRDHVYHRFTAGVDPRHVQPVWFYPDRMRMELEYVHAYPLVAFGLILFAVESIRRRSAPGLLVLLWFVIPLALISASTSKIYHYAYPFLPPLAIAGAYLPARLWEILYAAVGSAPRALETRGGAHPAGRLAFLRRRSVRLVLATLAVASVTLALVTLLTGPVRLQVGSVTLFRNSSELRPALVGLLLAILAGAPRRAMGVALLPLLILILPFPAYREMLERLETDRAPLRGVRDCVLDLQARDAVPRAGTYLEMPEKYFQHQYYYYFRVLGPWERKETPHPALLYQQLFDASRHRPLLVTEEWYSEMRQQLRAGTGPVYDEVRAASAEQPAALRQAAARPTPPMIDFTEILLLLPGPFGVCASAAGDR